MTIQGNSVSNNDNLGILISDSSLVTVGGSAAGEANSVDNNSGDGFYITNGSSDIILQGNSVSNNTSNGVAVDNSTFVTIGGSTVGSDNVISDNTNNGVDISGGSSDITVAGNTIDTNSNGINVASGTEITIGGSTSGSENTIVSNLADGVSMNTGSDIVSVLSNSIFDNGDLGIDLNSDGVTSNDTDDIDTGVNDLLNSPEANNITESSGNTNVKYTLDVPAGDYRIEFFGNSVADPSGYGEGEDYLGFTNITSNGTGDQLFNYTLIGITGITNLSQTTTKRNVATASGFGATSEFGKYTVTNDIALQKTISNPNDVAKGENITYNVKFTNNGPSDLDLSLLDGSGGFGVNPLFFDLYPTDLTFTESPTADASCTDLGPGSATGFGPALANHADHGIIECVYDGSGEVLTAGQSFTIQLNFTVSQSSSMEFSNYVMNFSAPNDPDENQIGALFAGELIDGFKASNINNFSEAQYPVPVTEEVPPSTGNNNNSTTLVNTALQKTGDILSSWYGLAGIVLSGAGITYYLRYGRKKIYKL